MPLLTMMLPDFGVSVITLSQPWGTDYAPHVSACPPHIFRPKAAEVGDGGLPDFADHLILSQTIYGGQIMLLTFIAACPQNFQTYLATFL